LTGASNAGLERRAARRRRLSVGPDQHAGRSGDRAEYRKLPRAVVCRVDQLDAVCPWSDVEVAGLTEVEQHRRISYSNLPMPLTR
jgi:hypothetical protein